MRTDFNYGISSCKDSEWNYFEHLFVEAEAGLVGMGLKKDKAKKA
jgi:hypothetical protein